MVIALLLLAFVTLSHTHSFFGKKTLRLVDTVKKADLGLQYAMQKEAVVNDTTPLRLAFKEDINLKSVKSYWGVFEKYTVVSTFNKNKIIKTALAGSIDINRPALYLQDMERPMIIAGKSKITGDVYLPKQGIRPGNIAGQSYYNKRLVYGREKQSNTELPKLNKGLQNHLNQMVSTANFNTAGRSISVASGEVIKNSFKNATITILGDVVNLSDISLTGNIIVLATQHIKINASTNLTDVILVAPKITVANNFKGQFQAIASEEITIGKSCVLAYPSAVIVNEEKNKSKNNSQEKKSNITIARNTSVKGVVMYLGESSEQLFYPQIHISEKATIIGEVYCTQNLELKGDVLGSVSTRSFMALENGSIYQNHLFNGVIDSSKLPLEYSGIVYEYGKEKTIVQWLY